MRTVPYLASLAAATAILTGCGGEPAAETPTPQKPVAEPTSVELVGTPMPEAVSNFRCSPVQSGQEKPEWTATGALTNTEKQSSDLQVTVYVGPADDVSRSAVTKRFANLGPGKSTKFSFENITGYGKQCRVQVLRMG